MLYINSVFQVAFPKIRDIQCDQGTLPKDPFSEWEPDSEIEACPPCAIRAPYVVAASAMAMISQAKLRSILGLPFQVYPKPIHFF